MSRTNPADKRTPFGQIATSVYAGAVVAIFTVIASLSLAKLIFAGNRSDGLSDGIGVALMSAVITGGVVAWRSSYSGTISIPQDRTAPILAILATHIATRLPSTTSAEVRILTILAGIALTSILTGG